MTKNEIRIFNTKIICECINSREFDLAFSRMKKDPFDHNRVLKSLIKINKNKYLEKAIEDNLLDLNHISSKSLNSCIVHKNLDALHYLLENYHLNKIMDAESFYLLACSKNAIDFIHVALNYIYKKISISIYIEGILYCHFMHNKAKHVIPDYIKYLILQEGIYIDFDIYKFATLKPILLKYKVFSINCLERSIYNGSVNYLNFFLEHKEALDFSLSYKENILLKKCLLSNNLEFAKILLDSHEVINSKSAFEIINKVKTYKNNETIDMAVKIINLYKF